MILEIAASAITFTISSCPMRGLSPFFYFFFQKIPPKQMRAFASNVTVLSQSHSPHGHVSCVQYPSYLSSTMNSKRAQSGDLCLWIIYQRPSSSVTANSYHRRFAARRNLWGTRTTMGGSGVGTAGLRIMIHEVLRRYRCGVK